MRGSSGLLEPPTLVLIHSSNWYHRKTSVFLSPLLRRNQNLNAWMGFCLEAPISMTLPSKKCQLAALEHHAVCCRTSKLCFRCSRACYPSTSHTTAHRASKNLQLSHGLTYVRFRASCSFDFRRRTLHRYLYREHPLWITQSQLALCGRHCQLHSYQVWDLCILYSFCGGLQVLLSPLPGSCVQFTHLACLFSL